MNKGKNRSRIGVVTYHRAINYGAILQVYALQEAIKKNGCECNIIDYRNSLTESKHKKITFADCHNLKDIVRFVFYSKFYNEKFGKFRRFASTYLNLSPVYHTIDELRKETSKYDKFICGSDQVWNCEFTNFDKGYFLDFTNDSIKKNSYAASFGFNNIPLKFVEEYRTLLKSFNKISVREWNGKSIINNLFEKDVEVVLDPTMLITKKEWESIAKDYKKKVNYILVYSFGSLTSTMKLFIEELSRQSGCEIVYISYTALKPIKATYEKCVGPNEFLGLFKNARYVVTNSFHGTAFSIIFNKDFFLEMLPESQGVNSRLENIMDVFNLRSRQIKNGENAFVKETVDYTKVNQILNVERKKSLEFLNKICGVGV